MSSGNAKETKGEKKKIKKIPPTNQKVQPFGTRITCRKRAIALAVRNI